MSGRTVRSDLLAGLVLLVNLLMAWTGAVAHEAHRVVGEAASTAVIGSQDAPPCYGSLAEPERKHQHHDDDGQGHAGSCCLFGCSASGILVVPSRTSPKSAVVAHIFLSMTSLHGIGDEPPRPPPRKFS